MPPPFTKFLPLSNRWYLTEVDDGRPASRRALNRLSTQTSVENVSADEMSSPVTSPDAPPAATHSRTPKPLFNDEEMEDLDERLEDQSIMSRCDIQQFSAYDALILVFY